jgi:hypothetical protein
MIALALFAVQGFFESRSCYRENPENRIEYGRYYCREDRCSGGGVLNGYVLKKAVFLCLSESFFDQSLTKTTQI